MCDTASVADHIEAGMVGLKFIAEGHLHVVELDLHAVQKRVIIGSTGRDLVQCVDHFDDPVQDPLGQDQAQVSRRRLERRLDRALRDAGRITPAPALQISEALYDDTASQHIGQTGDTLTVAVAVFEGLRKMLGDQQGEVGVLGLSGGILKTVAVDSDHPIGIFIDDDPVGIHAEGTDAVLKFLSPVDDLALIEFIRQV